MLYEIEIEVRRNVVNEEEFQGFWERYFEYFYVFRYIYKYIVK
jgi:hypothetical protein